MYLCIYLLASIQQQVVTDPLCEYPCSVLVPLILGSPPPPPPHVASPSYKLFLHLFSTRLRSFHCTLIRLTGATSGKNCHGTHTRGELRAPPPPAKKLTSRRAHLHLPSPRVQISMRNLPYILGASPPFSPLLPKPFPLLLLPPFLLLFVLITLCVE